MQLSDANFEYLVPVSSIINAIIYIHTYFIIENFCYAKIFNYKISMYVYDRVYNALIKVKKKCKKKKKIDYHAGD